MEKTIYWTRELIEERLYNYPHTHSSSRDGVIDNLSKNEVWHLSQAYNRGEAYVYSETDFQVELQERFQMFMEDYEENEYMEEEELLSALKELKYLWEEFNRQSASVVVSRNDNYYFVTCDAMEG